MTDLDNQTIKTIIQLSRIHCTDEEEQKIKEDLKKILNYAAQLEEVDTDGVPPCNHVLEDMVNVERDDIVIEEELLSRDKFLRNAPSRFGGMIKVPTIIKQKN